MPSKKEALKELRAIRREAKGKLAISLREAHGKLKQNGETNLTNILDGLIYLLELDVKIAAWKGAKP